jgi:YegS/Rv2252/BmrU family lipid kinase
MLAVINPVSRHGKGAQAAYGVLPDLKEKFELEVVESEGPGHIKELAASAEGFDVILVCGGDGSVHEAVNGIMLRSEKKPVLAYLPVGSGNDSARACGIPFNLKKAVEVIKRFETKKIDIGKMNNIYYSNSLGIGLDGMVAHQASSLRSRTRLKGVPLYLKALYEVIKNWEPFKLTFYIEDEKIYDESTMLAAINVGRSYGGGFFVTPNAFIDDGLFDVCIVREIPKYEVPLRLPFFIVGHYEWMGIALTKRGSRIRVEASRPVYAQLDGETYAIVEAKVELIPRAIEVIVSEKAFLKRGF